MTEAEAAVPQDIVDESSALPSDEEVIAELHKLLEGADFSTTTERMLRQQLEAHFGVDLKPKKAVIKEQVKACIDQHVKAQDDENDEEEEQEKERDAPQRRRAAAPKRKAPPKASESKRRSVTTSTAILSPELQAFLGESSMSRPQIVKRIWDYIKEHNLQNPKNRRSIIVDDTLRTLFTPPVDMFTINKQLSRHIKTGM